MGSRASFTSVPVGANFGMSSVLPDSGNPARLRRSYAEDISMELFALRNDGGLALILLDSVSLCRRRLKLSALLSPCCGGVVRWKREGAIVVARRCMNLVERECELEHVTVTFDLVGRACLLLCPTMPLKPRSCKNVRTGEEISSACCASSERLHVAPLGNVYSDSSEICVAPQD